LNPKLEATPTVQCYASRAVVGPREQLSPLYVYGESSPHYARAEGKAETAEAGGLAS
jgi:UPF0176 protein